MSKQEANLNFLCSKPQFYKDPTDTRIDSVGCIRAGEVIRTYTGVDDWLDHKGIRRQNANGRHTVTQLLAFRTQRISPALVGLVTSPQHSQFGRMVNTKASELGIGQANDGSFKKGVYSKTLLADQMDDLVLAPFSQARAEGVLRVLGVSPEDPARSLDGADALTVSLAAMALHAFNDYPVDTALAWPR